MNNKKFFSIGSVLSKFSNIFGMKNNDAEIQAQKQREEAELFAILDEMDLENKSDLIENNVKATPSKPINSGSTPAPHPSKKNVANKGTTDNDPNEPPGIFEYETVAKSSAPISEPKGVSDDDEINNAPSPKMPPPVGQKYIPQPRVEGERPLPPKFGEPLDIKPRAEGEPKPLPPKFGEDLSSVKKAKKSDEDTSTDDMSMDIKLPTSEQVSARVLEHRRRIAVMEALEKERLANAHSRKGPYLSR